MNGVCMCTYVQTYIPWLSVSLDAACTCMYKTENSNKINKKHTYMYKHTLACNSSKHMNVHVGHYSTCYVYVYIYFGPFAIQN